MYSLTLALLACGARWLSVLGAVLCTGLPLLDARSIPGVSEAAKSPSRGNHWHRRPPEGSTAKAPGAWAPQPGPPSPEQSVSPLCDPGRSPT